MKMSGKLPVADGASAVGPAVRTRYGVAGGGVSVLSTVVLLPP